MKRFFDYSIFALAIFLAFIITFEAYLQLPDLASWIGRWHPLVLHFPIVLVLVCVIQYWRKDETLWLWLAVTTLATLGTSITGFILSLENEVKGDLITRHQWLGIGVTSLMMIWYFFGGSISKQRIKVLQGLIVIVIVTTGHFGGMVTHGEDFLALKKTKEGAERSLPENPNIYSHIVQPILDEKCVSCHNENKAKGKLQLTNYSLLRAGGESGSGLNEQTGIIHRVNLPEDHDEHMPPIGEKQLDANEVRILEEWFRSGASEENTYADLEESAYLSGVVREMIKESKSNKWTGLPEVSDATLLKLSSDYCTIKRIFGGTNALQVLIFPHDNYNSDELNDMKKIGSNVVDLNLSNLPVTVDDIKMINAFENLEILNLSSTNISDEILSNLKGLAQLHTLKLYNTAITDRGLSVVSSIQNLQKAYVYHTQVTREGIDVVKAEKPGIMLASTAKEAADFSSVLPSPRVKNARHFFSEPFYIQLEHPLDEIDIRYTSDGSKPDLKSSTFGDSTLIDTSMQLKYFAAKNGWESSPIDSISFIRSIIKPIALELQELPDKKYRGRGKAVLFDLQKGSGDYGDGNWLGFKDTSFKATMDFGKSQKMRGVILSTMVATAPYIFPPTKIRVYGGTSENRMFLLKELKPVPLREQSERVNKYFHLNFNPTEVQFLKIEAEPIPRLPIWHPGKGERGWFFIDEVVFVEGD